MEAVEALKQGHYVTRNDWTDGSYIAFLPGMTYFWKVMTLPNPAAGNWLPLVSDVTADDWKILEVKTEEKPLDIAA